mmetsp:Transcript_24567/g.81702  ORF Transcript_24567/g.81702 Transcript_24567/m.81702 type:complete len:238 (+) Transcript_24567:824-1537(+)
MSDAAWHERTPCHMPISASSESCEMRKFSCWCVITSRSSCISRRTPSLGLCIGGAATTAKAGVDGAREAGKAGAEGAPKTAADFARVAASEAAALWPPRLGSARNANKPPGLGPASSCTAPTAARRPARSLSVQLLAASCSARGDGVTATGWATGRHESCKSDSDSNASSASRSETGWRTVPPELSARAATMPPVAPPRATMSSTTCSLQRAAMACPGSSPLVSSPSVIARMRKRAP